MGHVDVLDLGVLAGVLDLRYTGLVVFEDDDRADLIRLSGVELCIETLEPACFSGSFA